MCELCSAFSVVPVIRPLGSSSISFFTDGVTLGKTIDLSEPQFSPQKNGKNYLFYIRLNLKINILIYANYYKMVNPYISFVYKNFQFFSIMGHYQAPAFGAALLSMVS